MTTSRTYRLLVVGALGLSGCWTNCLENCPDPDPPFTRTITPADLEALEPAGYGNQCNYLCFGSAESPVPPDVGRWDAGPYQVWNGRAALCSVDGLVLTCRIGSTCAP